MEKIIIPTTSTKELDSKLACEIYDAIMKYGNADLAFKAVETNFDNENIVIVDKLIDKLFNELETIASGRKVIAEATPATFDEEGQELTPTIPAVYYIPTTKTDFKTQFDSGMFNSTTILSDFVASKGFEYTSEWEKFINSYNG
jgi:hypothetical protein